MKVNNDWLRIFHYPLFEVFLILNVDALELGGGSAEASHCCWQRTPDNSCKMRLCNKHSGRSCSPHSWSKTHCGHRSQLLHNLSSGHGKDPVLMGENANTQVTRKYCSVYKYGNVDRQQQQQQIKTLHLQESDIKTPESGHVPSDRRLRKCSAKWLHIILALQKMKFEGERWNDNLKHNKVTPKLSAKGHGVCSDRRNRSAIDAVASVNPRQRVTV